MKPRRVILTLEIETDAPLVMLRDASEYSTLMVGDIIIDVLQAQANVIEPWEERSKKTP